MDARPDEATRTRALRKWQWITLATLTGGYAGYYMCRANLSVATPLLLAPESGMGLDKMAIGAVVSAGVGTYAAGKLINGALCDFVGGRAIFLLGMVGSAVATAALGFAEGATGLMIAWSVNRYFQSMGWGALVKTAARWFEPARLGTVMAVLALSYLFGDAFAKLALGETVDAGLAWQGVFFVSAGILVGVAALCALTLRDSPTAQGLPEPRARLDNLYGEAGDAHRPANLLELLRPLLRSPSFLLVCTMSFGLTVIRETFNFWTPTYLAEVAGATEGEAARLSAVFPFFGGLSILVAGWVSDRFAAGRRGGVMVAFLVPAAAGMALLAGIEPGSGTLLPTLIISGVGLAMIGPYAFLSGAIAVDLGGKAASSTVAGIADAVGYFGSVASGWGVGALAQAYGWGAAFGALAALAVVTVVAAVAYWRVHELGARRT